MPSPSQAFPSRSCWSLKKLFEMRETSLSVKQESRAVVTFRWVDPGGRSVALEPRRSKEERCIVRRVFPPEEGRPSQKDA